MSAAPKQEFTQQPQTPTLELVPPVNQRLVPTERIRIVPSNDDLFPAAFAAAVMFATFVWFAFEVTIWAVSPSIGF